MIRDEDLNDFKEALKTYLKYNPDGPKQLQLHPALAFKLYNLLNDLDELVVYNIIPHYKMNYFPQDELMTYVINEMAKKIADKLIEDHYVTFSQTDEPDLAGTRIQASTIVLKRDSL